MPGVAARLAALRERRGPQAWRRCEAVQHLVVVCASSRGGSSLFGELLRRLPGLITASAEINPHVVIPTIGRGAAPAAPAAGPGASTTPWPGSAAPAAGPDLIADPTPVAGRGDGLRVLQTELGLDLGRPAAGAASAAHVAWRLTMQWPHEAIEPEAVSRWVDDAVAEVGTASRAETFLAVLQRARRQHPSVNPLAYDLPDDAVRRRFPHTAPPVGPPAPPVVEMAPFVVPRPWREANEAELSQLPVVLVTPRNAFRLPLLRAAFPNAEMRVVHLVRNPAAAVNGLIDGWHHHGFFSTPVDVALSIAGYSDRYPQWGSRWWCFDLPPRWRRWTRASLAEVCAFQWSAAHESTVDAVSRLGLDCHRVRFEDVVSSKQSRRRVLARLAGWLGAEEERFAASADAALPVVMPTAPPRPGRWRNRAGELAPVLGSGAVRDLAVELGYPADPATWL